MVLRPPTQLRPRHLRKVRRTDSFPRQTKIASPATPNLLQTMKSQSSNRRSTSPASPNHRSPIASPRSEFTIHRALASTVPAASARPQRGNEQMTAGNTSLPTSPPQVRRTATRVARSVRAESVDRTVREPRRGDTLQSRDHQGAVASKRRLLLEEKSDP